MKSLKKNNVLIMVLLAITVLMSVGFAVLSTTLNINGTAKVKSQTWDIHFENVNITEGSVEAIKEANIANDKATLVEYEIELSKPGDFYEFTVDAVNEGTLDSMIEMVTLSGIEGNENYVSYQATYLSGEEIKIGDALNASTSETYKIRIEYKKDIEDLPSEDIKVSLVFGVTYSQSKDGEVITNYYTLTGTAYGADGYILTEGEIEVHSKVVTSPINSDGTFILKNIPVGKHEIFIKDTTGNVINEGEFTLQTGDKTTIENNIVTANSTGNVELNIKMTDTSINLKNVCDYEEGQTWEFAYTGDIQEFNVPCQGTYQLEVWGAQGNNTSTTQTNAGVGGKGGYSYGNVELKDAEKLYIAVGGQISGYNGGGGSNKNLYGGNGGGATHIAIDNNRGEIKNYENYKSELLIVAGGGGGAGQTSVTTASTKVNGGNGGGLSGGNGGYSVGQSSGVVGQGGTQTSGGEGYPGEQNSQEGSFGQGGQNIYVTAGGGGGLYGGASGYYYNGATGGGGGSGYIGDVADGETIAGNASMPTYDGTSIMTGNAGDGYAKITLVSY